MIWMLIFISVYNWTDPILRSQIPVRAEIVGVQTLLTSSRYFHHIYDYYDFRDSIWSGDPAFEVVHYVKGTPISKALTCMKIYLYKQK